MDQHHCNFLIVTSIFFLYTKAKWTDWEIKKDNNCKQ